jgi:predicted NBD/HSP70 family sugar kinase
MLIAEIVSCSMLTDSETWWNKYADYFAPQAAHAINRYEDPLVITVYRGATQDAGHILCLGHMLNKEAKFEVLGNGAEAQFPDLQPELQKDKKNVLLFLPTEELKQKAAEKYALEKVDAIGMVWLLKPKQD